MWKYFCAVQHFYFIMFYFDFILIFSKLCLKTVIKKCLQIQASYVSLSVEVFSVIIL